MYCRGKVQSLHATIALLVETRNREVLVLNRALLEENEELKRTHGSTSQLAGRCRVELEKMTEQRDQLYAANQKHKERYRTLLERHTQQGEKVKTLAHSLQSATATRRIAHVPVEIIGKVGIVWMFINQCLNICNGSVITF